MVFDVVGNGIRQGDGDESKMAGTTKNERGAQGEATQLATSSLYDERTRGQHNERMMRDDVTTSWRDEKT